MAITLISNYIMHSNKQIEFENYANGLRCPVAVLHGLSFNSQGWFLLTHQQLTGRMMGFYVRYVGWGWFMIGVGHGLCWFICCVTRILWLTCWLIMVYNEAFIKFGGGAMRGSSIMKSLVRQLDTVAVCHGLMNPTGSKSSGANHIKYHNWCYSRKKNIN